MLYTNALRLGGGKVFVMHTNMQGNVTKVWVSVGYWLCPLQSAPVFMQIILSVERVVEAYCTKSAFIWNLVHSWNPPTPSRVVFIPMASRENLMPTYSPTSFIPHKRPNFLIFEQISLWPYFLLCSFYACKVIKRDEIGCLRMFC